MFHRSIAAVLFTLITLAACETLPLGAPDRITAAEHQPPLPPPAPEVCWVEGPSCTASDPDEAARLDFVRQLAGPGVLDAPAFDGWVAALQARGWLPQKPELEPHPNGRDRAGRWFLTPAGRAALPSLGIDPG